MQRHSCSIPALQKSCPIELEVTLNKCRVISTPNANLARIVKTVLILHGIAGHGKRGQKHKESKTNKTRQDLVLNTITSQHPEIQLPIDDDGCMSHYTMNLHPTTNQQDVSARNLLPGRRCAVGMRARSRSVLGGARRRPLR